MLYLEPILLRHPSGFLSVLCKHKNLNSRDNQQKQKKTTTTIEHQLDAIMSAVVLPPSSSGQAVRIEEADDPGLALASQVAFDLIDLLTAAEEASTPPKKAPHLPGKKAEGEPGLLKSEEGESHAPSEPISDLPASLLQLGDGRQQQNQVLADEVQVQGAVASGSSSQSAIPASRRVCGIICRR